MGNCTSGIESPKAPLYKKIITAKIISDPTLWEPANPAMVFAEGPGTLKLLAVPDSSKLGNCCGRKILSTSRTDFDYSEFTIPLAYLFKSLIFYWQGDEEASRAQYGPRVTGEKLTLGKSWREATEVTREGEFNKVCLENDYFTGAEVAPKSMATMTYPNAQDVSRRLRRSRGHHRERSRSPGRHEPGTSKICTTTMPCSNGLYLSPKMGSTVDSIAQPLNVSWDPTCLTASEVDIYLYAPNSALPRIHVWEHVALSRGSYSAQLMPRWWNATNSQQLQIIIVPTGDPPFMSTFPAGPVFTATYSSTGSSPPPAADTSIVDSGVTSVNDVANQKASKSALSGRAAAGVLVPLFFIALAVFAYIKWKRRKEQHKRKAWTEKVDRRMSTISTEWKSVSAAGAQAAIRNSIAVASRNSSFSFGPIRPNSTVDLNDSDSAADRNPAMRTGTGVGLRNPNSLSSSRNSTTSTRVSRVSFAPDPRVSRVSFAESTDSSSINRKNVPSRAFHSAYIPPVPALPEGITSVYIPEKSQDREKEKDNLSPRQTAGPLTLTSDDIKARIAASASGRPTKGSMSGLDDEMLPALSMMRTGNMETSGTDDYLLPTAAPQVPDSTYSPTTPTITSSFPVPPTNIQLAAPSVVLSPDEMLRAYAERKKSLADAARAGRIGGPLRASVVPSIAASAITTHSGSTVNNNSGMSTNSGGSLGMGTGKVETVSSIHATGMRVAYNDADGLALPPSVPSGYHQDSHGSPQTKPIFPLSISGKGSKGIEGGKALLGKVKNMGKKRKSMNPFAKADPEAAVTEEEHEADGVDNNPGEAYVAALEAEAAETEAERQLNATHNLGDDVVGAYPYVHDQQQQYYGGYDGQYYGYGYQYGAEQGEGEVYAYDNGEGVGEEGQQGGQAYGY